MRTDMECKKRALRHRSAGCCGEGKGQIVLLKKAANLKSTRLTFRNAQKLSDGAAIGDTLGHRLAAAVSAQATMPQRLVHMGFFGLLADTTPARAAAGTQAPAATLAAMEAWIQQLLAWLALPQFGLSTVFIVALISATLLPLGSEPAVAGLLHLNPDLFWQAILVATAGNTLGGAISWWTGALARTAWYKARRLRHAGHGAAPANPLIPASPPTNKAATSAWPASGCANLAPRHACSAGCPSWAIRCALWPAGCACRSGPVCSIWRLANFCATC